MTRLCALCGFRYEPGGSACRERACPLALVGCRTLDCPRCGHATPDEGASALARWIRRLLAGEPARVADERTLAELRPGDEGIVDAIDAEPGLVARLAAQGLAQGASLFLVQRRPSFVVDIGETTLALERKVAARIRMR
jgi:Fe2+ transport system protein FeoA